MAARMCFAAIILTFITILVGSSNGAHFAYAPSGKSTCIMMDAKFQIRINAVRYMRTIATDVINSEDQVIDISGSCGATSAILNMAFSGGRVTWSFIFRIDGDIVTLDRLIQFAPKTIFASFVTNISDPLTFDDPNTIDLSHKDESYVCKTTKKSNYFPIKPIKDATTFSIQTIMHHVQAQAFGLKGRYSRSKSLCGEDIANLTTRSTSTVIMTVPTTEIIPTNAPDNVYYVTNPQNTTVCIALAGRIDVDIRYKYNTTEGKIRKRTVSFPVPNNATWHGQCNLGDGRQYLVIDFYQPSWSLEFIFKRKANINSTGPVYMSGKTQQNLDYSIESINLVYFIDQVRFPRSILPDKTKVRESSTQEESRYPHKSTGKGYFVCASDITLRINKNAAITTQDLKFKAFNENDRYNFEGSSCKCAADDNDNTTRAIIIVGSVMGGIVIIIAIIIAISVMGRRRKRRYYKPIKSIEDRPFVYH